MRNDGDFHGGYEPAEIERLLTFADVNFSEWARSMAELIAATEKANELSSELLASFCRAEPKAARQLARTTFTMDYRDKLGQLKKPTLILQCTDDGLAHVDVGRYVQHHVAGSVLKMIDTSGQGGLDGDVPVGMSARSSRLRLRLR